MAFIEIVERKMEKTHLQMLKTNKNDEIVPFLESAQKRQPLIRKNNEIPQLETFEDFLSFAKQVFDNNEPWHIFMLPVYVLRFHSSLTDEQITQLESVFEQASKCIDKWNFKIGLTDRAFAAYFLSYGQLLNKKNPESSNPLKDIVTNIEIYPFYYIPLKTLDSLKEGIPMDLLSTPTHTPLWIDPEILVRRLIKYQQQNKEPYGLDIQLAILRCALDDTKEALEIAKQELNGELRELFIYLFSNEIELPAKVDHPVWWICAEIQKYPRTIPVKAKEWGIEMPSSEFLTGDFKWAIEDNGYGIYMLKVKLPIYNIKSHSENTFLPYYYYSMYRSRNIWPGDIQRIISSIPHNPDTVIAQFINRICNYNSMDPYEKSGMINGLIALANLRLPLSCMGYLLVALSMFAPDKEIKDYGASLWKDQVQTGLLDTQYLAETMAKLLHAKWLPLKHFIDLIETNMINISNLHNEALEELIAAFLNAIGQKKLTNLKKLHEIYTALQAVNKK